AGPHPSRHRRTPARGSRSPRLARTRPGPRNRTLYWTAVRELTRVATPETERQWLSAAHRRTLREIERMVCALPRGAEPDDRKGPKARPPLRRPTRNARRVSRSRGPAPTTRPCSRWL